MTSRAKGGVGIKDFVKTVLNPFTKKRDDGGEGVSKII